MDAVRKLMSSKLFPETENDVWPAFAAAKWS